MIEKLMQMSHRIARRVSRGKNVDDYISEANEALATLLPIIDFTRTEKEIQSFVAYKVERACFDLARKDTLRASHFRKLPKDVCAVPESHTFVEDLVEKLPEDTRDIAEAVYVDRLPLREVADKMGIGYGTAQRRVKAVQLDMAKLAEDVS